MKKENVVRPLWMGIKKLKKLFIMLMIVVLLFVSIGIFIFKDFSFGYRYYEFNQQNIEVTVGYSKEKINMFSIMEEYLEQLENDGYVVASYDIKKDIGSKMTVVPKHKIDNEQIKQLFIDCFDVDVFCKKVTIGEDVYYFKNESDKETFVKELNSIKSIEYSTEEVIEDKSIITKQEILDKKISDTREKENARLEQIKKERERQKQVTSRSGSAISRNTKYKGGAPLASYVYISSYYGMRNGRMHTGVDYAANGGTHIYAWKSGTVTFVGWSGGYGKFIIIDHGDGTVSRYAHCSGYAVTQGQKVSKGQTIGYVGTTGNSTGNHLHFEIKINGNFVNPLNYL